VKTSAATETAKPRGDRHEHVMFRKDPEGSYLALRLGRRWWFVIGRWG
jgi:hypothetical protein